MNFKPDEINIEYIMCMVCKNSAFYKNGKIECEYEDEEGSINSELRKNFDCHNFDFYAPNLIELLIRIIKELQKKKE